MEGGGRWTLKQTHVTTSGTRKGENAHGHDVPNVALSGGSSTTVTGGRCESRAAAPRIGCDWAAEDSGRRHRAWVAREPHFTGRRLATITTADVNTFILKRRTDVIVCGAGEDRTERKVSNGEINRELTTLKHPQPVLVAFLTTCGGPPCASWCARAFPSAWQCR